MLGRSGALTLAQEIDDLVEEWTPDPLVPPTTAFEDAELEKRPVIVGLVVPQERGYHRRHPER